jgi:hypothetical protein
MKTLIIKSLLTSLCQRKEMYPSLEKRGKGRFFNNDALLMNLLVTHSFYAREEDIGFSLILVRHSVRAFYES